MKQAKYRLILPVVPVSLRDSGVNIFPSTGSIGPLFKGDGDTDLLCGNCNHAIAENLHHGQIQGINLGCPKCGELNAIVQIPKLKEFVSNLQNKGIPIDGIPTFKSIIRKAIKENPSPQTLATEIHQKTPEFGWFADNFIPQNSGEMYGFLSFTLALLAWWQSRPKSITKEPQVIINNFFNDRVSAKSKKPERNQKCPCGSGKKFKKCHGR